jgi:hypothetical protein
MLRIFTRCWAISRKPRIPLGVNVAFLEKNLEDASSGRSRSGCGQCREDLLIRPVKNLYLRELPGADFGPENTVFSTAIFLFEGPVSC